MIYIIFLIIIIIFLFLFFRNSLQWQENLTIKNNIGKIDSFVRTHRQTIFVHSMPNNLIYFLLPYHKAFLHKKIGKIREENKGRYFLLLDGEPNPIKNIHADLIISTKQNPQEYPENIPYIYLPYFVYSFVERNIDPKVLTRENTDFSEKKKFCCFLYSNCDEKYSGVLSRKQFYKLLNKRSNYRVENKGRCYNNNYISNGWWHDNIDIYKEYKFVISFENKSMLGYVTEKIWVPKIHGSIPIYLGAPNISDFFNTKSFIHVSDFPSFNACIDYILKVDSDDQLYKKILQEPFLLRNEVNDSLFSYYYGGQFYQELKKKLPSEISKYVRPCKLYKNKFVYLTYYPELFKDKLDSVRGNVEDSGCFDEYRVITNDEFEFSTKKYSILPIFLQNELQTLEIQDVLIYIDFQYDLHPNSFLMMDEYFHKLCNENFDVLLFLDKEEIPIHDAKIVSILSFLSIDSHHLKSLQLVNPGIIFIRKNKQSFGFLESLQLYFQKFPRYEAILLSLFYQHNYDTKCFAYPSSNFLQPRNP